jgi:hypothetical protein
MASMNQGRPCAARLVRTGNRVGSAASLAGSAKPDTSTARSRDSVTRTEQARDRRIAAVLDRGGGGPRQIGRYIRPPVRISRTISSNMTAPMVE